MLNEIILPIDKRKQASVAAAGNPAVLRRVQRVLGSALGDPAVRLVVPADALCGDDKREKIIHMLTRFVLSRINHGIYFFM